ncbi:restriction endonuclease subunit S [Escherichia coli]|uniref:restriction endonuclease subunit S n=1 Tax=Escherichia coli TaxID=562 RepID=UPI00227FAD1F|nr:restriction endonuclease subunit S [Escherichia coli]MCZ0274762.1 restriction endonuclease subunit S [Escherichia coli]MCZ0292933.1 restriction endonuclease subunit S [Escherichia coli]MCZ0298575.1 restriction endonuclease subunit S [Escherichia coli]MCZ0432605.1 restriction endonuclease subunit S [Escherichia coli]MCZ0452000.1 restriction endonuclease subunit S [Escherichia coli]
MSELSYLEKLLDGAEVEWVALNKLATFLKGKSLPKEKITPDGNRYCIHYGELFTHYGPIIDKVCSKTNQAINESILSEKNDVLMPTSDVTPRGLATASCIQESGVILGGDILIIRCSGVDGRYLSNFIINNKKKILQMVKGSTVYHLYAKDIGKLLIPIPCPNNPEKSLAIQSEIVRILDKFTALTAELTAELNMRKKQYNYYRDQLLSFDEEQEKPIYLEKLLDGVEVEWLPLSDLARIRNGKDHKSLSEGEFPVYGSGGIMRYVDTYAYNKPSVLIPRKGSLGNLFFIDVPFWTVDTIFYTEIDEAQIRPKYLYYFLSTVGLGEMNQAGGVPSQTQSVLNKLKIPIPCPDNPEKSLAIQSEIVRILDKFDTLTNSITEGLPREIELRQKQYEYYRDLLFSFPKSETVSN